MQFPWPFRKTVLSAESVVAYQSLIDEANEQLSEFEIVLSPVIEFREMGMKGFVARGKSEYVWVTICTFIRFEFIREINITVEPVAAGTHPEPLWYILMAKAGMRFVPREVRSMQEIQEEVRRQVSLLMEHCRIELGGDLSGWHAIDTYSGLSGEQCQTDAEWEAVARQVFSGAVEARQYLWASVIAREMREKHIKLTREEKSMKKVAWRELRRLQRDYSDQDI